MIYFWNVTQYIFGVDICQTTGRHIANDNNIRSHCRVNFKSHVTDGHLRAPNRIPLRILRIQEVGLQADLLQKV